MGEVVMFHKMSDDDVRDVEMALLGILLAHPHKLMEVRGIVQAEAFAFVQNRAMFELIRSAVHSGAPLDARSMIASLDDALFEGNLQKRSYVSDCVALVAAASQAVPYARTIMGAYNRRRIRDLAVCEMDEAEKARSISELWREMEGASASDGVITLASSLENTFRNIEDNYRSGGGFLGIKTPAGHFCECSR